MITRRVLNPNPLLGVPLMLRYCVSERIKTYCAIKALAMIIVVKSLDPTVTGFDWKATRDTFGGEQFVPIWKK